MERLDGDHGVIPGGCIVNLGVVNTQLASVGGRPLSRRLREVRAQAINRHSHASEVASERVDDELRHTFRSSGVMVQKNERNVVPILRTTALEGLRDLGEQETGQA